MEHKDVAGAQLAVHYLVAFIEGGGAPAFRTWCQREIPQRWRQWATSRGLAEDDDALVEDVVLALQSTVIEASRLHLDKMQAVLQAREVLGEL